MMKVFIGYDEREPVAFHVCAQSIIEHSSIPVSITPLKLSLLKKIFHRERDKSQLTDFSFTRFLVPYLCDYQDWGLFIDGDMLIREDIKNLWELRDNQFDIMLVKHHDFTGNHTFLDTTLKLFPRFNWSSVMLFNNAQCKILTPEYLQTVELQDVHQFKFIKDENKLGELPAKWNYLVGYSKPNPNPALVHWTLGGPYFEKFKDAEFASEWFAMREKTVFSKS